MDTQMTREFTPPEERLLSRLRTPSAIQTYLDNLPYNKEPRGATCYSPRLVIKNEAAHCMEGALFAALALRRLGHAPLIVDLEAVRDSDHVIAVYKSNGRWGALAKSDYSGLRSRSPVYANIRELVMSYFEHYYNPRGEKTLRAFCRPVNLARFDRTISWMTTLEQVWEIPSYLCEIPHTTILHSKRGLPRMDQRLYWAGRLGGANEPLLRASTIAQL